jgi:hypothetical protein
MIFLDRDSVPAPAALDLTDPTSKAARELAEAVQRLGTNHPMKSEDFSAYKDDGVREALTELSHGKCAYCESPVSGSSQTDIEHYRPKGMVRDKPDHPGYWWLAMDWNNLVLSCMHCNQSRRQMVIDPDWSAAEIRAVLEQRRHTTVGKKNAFPTLDAIWIEDHTADITTEKPALIDPTVTDPEGMFEWVYSTGLVSTMKGIDSDGRARITIDELGLNRRYLTEARMTRQAILNRHARQVRKFLDQFNAATTPEAEQLALTNLLDELDSLELLGAPEQPFSAMARDFLSRQRALIDAALGG